MRHLWIALPAVYLLGVCAAQAQEKANIPLGGAAMENLRPVSLPNVAASAEKAEDVLRVTFEKKGQERRLLALETAMTQNAAGAKALSMVCRLELTAGDAPRLALLAYEKDGGAWYKLSATALPKEQLGEVRMPVGSFRRAAFAQDKDTELQWDQVNKIWLGLAFDGPAKGTWELSKANLTSEPYRPTEPLCIEIGEAEAWGVSKDARVKATVTTPNEGPDGKKCMRFDFTFPGGSHMYAIPSIDLPDAELEGYTALQFTYKATLPEGLKGLLAMLGERNNAQWIIDPPPPGCLEWETVLVPFDEFKLGSWTKDPSGELEMEEVNKVMVGTHGVATKGGAGTIWVADVQLVP